MRTFCVLIAVFTALSVKPQCKIVGRLFDYDSNYPIVNCIVRFDSIIKDHSPSEHVCFSNDSGYFQINRSNPVNLEIEISQAGYERLILKNIPNEIIQLLILVISGCLKAVIIGMVHAQKSIYGD
jgi:hypothetical protein